VLFFSDDDSRSSLYDLTERIRRLNEEMAKEPPMPADALSQSSVKFKDQLVDFISPTPEPQWDSEGDGGSSQNTPRTDGAEESESQSHRSDPDPVSSSSEDSSTRNESGQPDQPLPQNPETSSSSVSESEADRSKSDQELNAREDKLSGVGERSLKIGAQPVASSPSDTDRHSVVANSEAVTETDSKKTDKISGSSAKQLSNRSRAARNTVLTATVVRSRGKPTTADSAQTAETESETTDRTSGSPSDETQSLDRKLRTVQNTLPASRILGSPRPRLVAGPQKTSADSESDDLALVERSGKFRMMSVAELTTIRRQCASHLPPGDATCTPRPPSTRWNHSSR